MIKAPKIVESLIGDEIARIACSEIHVVAVTTDNEVFSWGKRSELKAHFTT